MSTAPPVPRARPPMPHRPPPPAARPASAPHDTVTFGPIPTGAGQRIVLFGPGGIGKTRLTLAAPGPVAVFDLDDSLHVLRPQLPEAISRQIKVVPATDWQAMRDALHADGWGDIRTINIDTATRAEELDVAWTIANVKHEKPEKVISSIEDYGYGKGYQHVYDIFLLLLQDLDAHVRAGRNVILVCHDCTATVPNPTGQDWLRYEPRLQSVASGKASIRLRVREWADHLLFYGYDVDVKDRKGRGSGTRTIYPTELPHCMAKSRRLADPIPMDRTTDLWAMLFNADQSGEPTDATA